MIKYVSETLTLIDPILIAIGSISLFFASIASIITNLEKLVHILRGIVSWYIRVLAEVRKYANRRYKKWMKMRQIMQFSKLCNNEVIFTELGMDGYVLGDDAAPRFRGRLSRSPRYWLSTKIFIKNITNAHFPRDFAHRYEDFNKRTGSKFDSEEILEFDRVFFYQCRADQWKSFLEGVQRDILAANLEGGLFDFSKMNDNGTINERG
jgi:hypothetical protein